MLHRVEENPWHVVWQAETMDAANRLGGGRHHSVETAPHGTWSHD